MKKLLFIAVLLLGLTSCNYNQQEYLIQYNDGRMEKGYSELDYQFEINDTVLTKSITTTTTSHSLIVGKYVGIIPTAKFSDIGVFIVTYDKAVIIK